MGQEAHPPSVGPSAGLLQDTGPCSLPAAGQGPHLVPVRPDIPAHYSKEPSFRMCTSRQTDHALSATPRKPSPSTAAPVPTQQGLRLLRTQPPPCPFYQGEYVLLILDIKV